MPFANPAFAGAVPSPAGPQQFDPNYMMAGNMAGNMAGFPMAAAGMPQQHPMMQRMPPQPGNAVMAGNGAPQRPPSASQGTPTGSMPNPAQLQQQFSTPQQPPPQSQTPTNQQPSTTVTTPQTPTFPSVAPGAGTNGTAAMTPMSPRSESRDKERITVLLEINQ